MALCPHPGSLTDPPADLPQAATLVGWRPLTPPVRIVFMLVVHGRAVRQVGM